MYHPCRVTRQCCPFEPAYPQFRIVTRNSADITRNFLEGPPSPDRIIYSGNTGNVDLSISTRSSPGVLSGFALPFVPQNALDQPKRGDSKHSSRDIVRQCHPKKHRHVPLVHKCHVKYIDITKVLPKRAGVIIYTTIGGRLYFGMGLDTRTHDLTDFGGGVVYSKDKDCIVGALREFEEETLGIFDKIYPEDIKECLTIYDENNIIVFLHMNVDPEGVCSSFNSAFDEMLRQKKFSEICGFSWLTKEEMEWSILTKGILFYKVKNLLSAAGDFYIHL